MCLLTKTLENTAVPVRVRTTVQTKLCQLGR